MKRREFFKRIGGVLGGVAVVGGAMAAAKKGPWEEGELVSDPGNPVIYYRVGEALKQISHRNTYTVKVGYGHR